MDINIDIILEDLKEGKAPRTKSNLDKLNSILKEYSESGQRDFSITQIGRISAAKGGLAYEALRATRNKHYRMLIEAWAQKCNTNTKKPISPHARSKSIPEDNKLLERIPDAAVRALFGQIIAERNRYRKEVNLLKQHANITIDKRPVRQFDSSTEPGVVLIPSVSSLLIESERKALAYAISDECMTQHNWQYTKMGQVKDVELGTEIFPRGFVTGIRKLLGEVDSNG
jgi:hypothetical protein